MDIDIVDMHLSLYSPFSIKRFPVMFRGYVRSWYYRSNRRNVVSSDYVDEDMYRLYSEFVGVPEYDVNLLADGDSENIPTLILKDMGLAVSKGMVAKTVYDEEVILIRDKVCEA